MKASLDPQHTYAILMGMTKFKGFASMPPASRNVEQLASILADPSIIGLSERQIRTIVDVNSSDAKHLFSKYVTEAKEAQAKSLLIYYVGHGYRRTDGLYFFTTTDSDPHWINFDGSTVIAYEGGIKKILKNANIPQIFFIVDACYSGTLAQSNAVHLPELDLLASYTLTSSAADEESFFDTNHDHTHFTAELINILEHGLSNDKERLTLADLYDALRRNIHSKGLKMSPQHSAGKELQPHLYTFCKNKAFNPIKQEIQRFESEIKEIQNEIKKGKAKNSKLHLLTLRADVEKDDILDPDTRKNFIECVDNLLFFCTWYLQYETIFLNEIIENAILSKSRFIKEELEHLKNHLQNSNKKLGIAKIDLKASTSYIANLNKKLELAYTQKLELLNTLSTVVLNEQRQYGMISELDKIAQSNLLKSDDTFRVLVVGGFNVGKSTLINALIGEEISPTNPLECTGTGVPIILKFGENKIARLHFKADKKAPRDISLKKLEQYVLINYNSEEYSEQDNEISYVEVYWPLDKLSSYNLEIIDTPSFNDNNADENIISKLPKIDLVIFMMSATRFGPRSVELNIINKLRLEEYYDVFFIVNHWDSVRPKSNKDLIKSRALDVLSKLTTHKQDIYFISALNALEGRIGDELKSEQESGIKNFEDGLNRLLNENRSSIKLRRIAREVKKNINNLRLNTIPERINLLEIELYEKKTMLDAFYVELEKISGTQREILDPLQGLLIEHKENLQTKITDIENFKSRLEQIDNYLESFIKAKPS